MPSACFEPKGSSSGRRLYIQFCMVRFTCISIRSLVGRRMCLCFLAWHFHMISVRDAHFVTSCSVHFYWWLFLCYVHVTIIIIMFIVWDYPIWRPWFTQLNANKAFFGVMEQRRFEGGFRQFYNDWKCSTSASIVVPNCLGCNREKNITNWSR